MDNTVHRPATVPRASRPFPSIAGTPMDRGRLAMAKTHETKQGQRELALFDVNEKKCC
jgi:hypothetical protein